MYNIATRCLPKLQSIVQAGKIARCPVFSIRGKGQWQLCEIYSKLPYRGYTSCGVNIWGIVT